MKAKRLVISAGLIAFLSIPIVACQTQNPVIEVVKDFLGDSSKEDQAIKLNPNDVIALNRRATLRSEHGNRQGAIADFTEVIRISCRTPKDCDVNAANAYSNRGQEYRLMRSKQKALADYHAAMEIYKQLKHDNYILLIQTDIKQLQEHE
jgi:tetratricopeptide (TPR) repeat protein